MEDCETNSGSNEAIIDHRARLARSQREWLLNVKNTSSDTDDSSIIDRNKRKALAVVERIPDNHKSKLGAALRRFSIEKPKHNSSSSDTDTDDGKDENDKKIVVDRSSMYRGRRGSRGIICQDNSSFSPDHKVHKSPQFRNNNSRGYQSDDGRKMKTHIVLIGSQSLNLLQILVDRSDSIEFVLVDVETLPEECILTGVSVVESLRFEITLKQSEGRNKYLFCPVSCGVVVVTCSVDADVHCILTVQDRPRYEQSRSTDISLSMHDDAELCNDEPFYLGIENENPESALNGLTECKVEDIYPNQDLDHFYVDKGTELYSEERPQMRSHTTSTVFFQNPMKLKQAKQSGTSKKSPFMWQTRDSLLGVGVSMMRKSAGERPKSSDSRDSKDRGTRIPSLAESKNVGNDGSDSRGDPPTPRRGSPSEIDHSPSYSSFLSHTRGNSLYQCKYSQSHSSAYDSDDISLSSDNYLSDTERAKKVKKITKVNSFRSAYVSSNTSQKSSTSQKDQLAALKLSDYFGESPMRRESDGALDIGKRAEMREVIGRDLRQCDLQNRDLKLMKVFLEDFRFRPASLDIFTGSAVEFTVEGTGSNHKLSCENEFSGVKLSSDSLTFQHVFRTEGYFEVRNEIFSFMVCKILVSNGMKTSPHVTIQNPSSKRNGENVLNMSTGAEPCTVADAPSSSSSKSSQDVRDSKSSLYAASNPIVARDQGTFSTPRLHGSFSSNSKIQNENKIDLKSGSKNENENPHIIDYIPPWSLEHSEIALRIHHSPSTDKYFLPRKFHAKPEPELVPESISRNTPVAWAKDAEERAEMRSAMQARRKISSASPRADDDDDDDDNVVCVHSDSEDDESEYPPHTPSVPPVSTPITAVTAAAASTPTSGPSADPPHADYFIKTNRLVIGVISQRIQEKIMAELNGDLHCNDNEITRSSSSSSSSVQHDSTNKNGNIRDSDVKAIPYANDFDTQKGKKYPTQPRSQSPYTRRLLSQPLPAHTLTGPKQMPLKQVPRSPSPYKFPPSRQTEYLTHTTPHTQSGPSGLRGSFGTTTSSARPARELTEEVRNRARARGLMGGTATPREEVEEGREDTVCDFSSIYGGSVHDDGVGGNLGKSSDYFTENPSSKFFIEAREGRVRDENSEVDDLDDDQENEVLESGKQRRSKKKNLKKKLKKVKNAESSEVPSTFDMYNRAENKDEFCDLEIGESPRPVMSRVYSPYTESCLDVEVLPDVPLGEKSRRIGLLLRSPQNKAKLLSASADWEGASDSEEGEREGDTGSNTPENHEDVPLEAPKGIQAMHMLDQQRASSVAVRDDPAAESKPDSKSKKNKKKAKKSVDSSRKCTADATPTTELQDGSSSPMIPEPASAPTLTPALAAACLTPSASTSRESSLESSVSPSLSSSLTRSIPTSSDLPPAPSSADSRTLLPPCIFSSEVQKRKEPLLSDYFAVTSRETSSEQSGNLSIAKSANIPNRFPEHLSQHSLPLSEQNLADQLRTQLGIGHLNGAKSRLQSFTPPKNVLQPSASRNVPQANVLGQSCDEVETEGIEECFTDAEREQQEIEEYLSNRWGLIEGKMLDNSKDCLPRGKVVPIIEMGPKNPMVDDPKDTLISLDTIDCYENYFSNKNLTDGTDYNNENNFILASTGRKKPKNKITENRIEIRQDVIQNKKSMQKQPDLKPAKTIENLV